MIQLLILALLPISTLGASEVGCYSSLPSSFSDESTFNFQSSSHCADQCSDYSYFALTKGNTCICGNDSPSGSTSDSCNSKCYGYGQEMCGGDDAYSVYSTGNSNSNNGNSDSSSSSGGSGDSSTTSSSTDNTDSSTSTTSTSTSTSTSKSSTSTNSPTTTTPSSSTTTTQSNTSSKETVLTTNDGGKTSTVVQTVAETDSSSPTSTTSDSQASSTSSSSSSASSSSSDSKDDKGSKKTNLVGPVVGGVVGGVALVALVSLLFFFLRRRTSTKRDAELADSAYYDAIKRDNSTVARPLSNPFLSKEDFTDQRLNPVMLGRRRISEGSLADEADYSRKILRVANPDDDL